MRDPMMRRCGWSTVWGDASGPDASVFGALPGSQQTAHRAKIYALLSALRVFNGHLTVYSDCGAVCRTFARAPTTVVDSNPDLWREIWELTRNRPGLIRVCRVPAKLEHGETRVTVRGTPLWLSVCILPRARLPLRGPMHTPCPKLPCPNGTA